MGVGRPEEGLVLCSLSCVAAAALGRGSWEGSVEPLYVYLTPDMQGAAWAAQKLSLDFVGFKSSSS